MSHAAKAYAKVAKETATPRELEAFLLLKAAAKLQAVHDIWPEKSSTEFNDALLYNRKLWTVFIDSIVRDDSRLPQPLSENLKTLGAFVMCETFSLMTKPQQKHMNNLIKINRRIAAGLLGRH